VCHHPTCQRALRSSPAELPRGPSARKVRHHVPPAGAPQGPQGGSRGEGGGRLSTLAEVHLDLHIQKRGLFTYLLAYVLAFILLSYFTSCFLLAYLHGLGSAQAPLLGGRTAPGGPGDLSTNPHQFSPSDRTPGLRHLHRTPWVQVLVQGILADCEQGGASHVPMMIAAHLPNPAYLQRSPKPCNSSELLSNPSRESGSIL